MRVGFIGLGLMGNPMAKNIYKAGFSLGVYNRTKSKTVEFKKRGIPVYPSPLELAKHSDVIISMITGPKDVAAVYFGKNGIVKADRRLIAIDMSTIGPSAALTVSKKLKKYQIDFLDAPVNGSVPKAESGELTIFVGGNRKSFDKVKEILLAMGKTIHYIGGIGSGQAVKLVNNAIIASTIVTLSEGMMLGDTLGLPRKTLAKALENVPGLSPFMRLKLHNIVSSNYAPIFTVANMHKDLQLALYELRKNNSIKKFPLLHSSASLYKKGTDTKLGDEDISAVIKILE